MAPGPTGWLAVVFCGCMLFVLRSHLDHPLLWSDVIIENRHIEYGRLPSGTITMKGGNDMDFLYALGYAHGNERLVQMILQRTVARGELSLLRASEENLKLDKLFREQNFQGKSTKTQTLFCTGFLMIVERSCAASLSGSDPRTTKTARCLCSRN